MFLLIKSCAQLFMTKRTNCKHRLPDTYIIKDCANIIKFIKIASNSTENRQKIQKAQNDKKIIFQKNGKKMQTYVKPY